MAVLRKVGIIGIGHVGAHVANAVLSVGLAEELKLCDINEQKVVSECQDLSDTLSFYPHNCVIGNYGTQYEQLADCDVVINAAGDVKTSAKDRDGELFVTTDIARTWISRLFNAGFHGVIITISNPCDVVASPATIRAKSLAPEPRWIPHDCATPSRNASTWIRNQSAHTCWGSMAIRSSPTGRT